LGKNQAERDDGTSLVFPTEISPNLKEVQRDKGRWNQLRGVGDHVPVEGTRSRHRGSRKGVGGGPSKRRIRDLGLIANGKKGAQAALGLLGGGKIRNVLTKERWKGRTKGDMGPMSESAETWSWGRRSRKEDKSERGS